MSPQILSSDSAELKSIPRMHAEAEDLCTQFGHHETASNNKNRSRCAKSGKSHWSNLCFFPKLLLSLFSSMLIQIQAGTPDHSQLATRQRSFETLIAKSSPTKTPCVHSQKSRTTNGTFFLPISCGLIIFIVLIAMSAVVLALLFVGLFTQTDHHSKLKDAITIVGYGASIFSLVLPFSERIGDTTNRSKLYYTILFLGVISLGVSTFDL